MQTEDGLLDVDAVAAIVGGSKGPVSKATVFRLTRRRSPKTYTPEPAACSLE